MSTTALELAAKTRDELRRLARLMGIVGFSKLNKTELQHAILAAAGMLEIEPHIPIHEVVNDREGLIGWFDSFGGAHDWDFLSNFHVGEPISLMLTWGTLAQYWGWDLEGEGIDPDAFITGATGEHLFAAFKTKRLWDFLAVLSASHKDGSPDPGRSKGRGHKVKLRRDWEAVKYDVMMMVLRAKFTLDRAEGRRLLGTGDCLLIEGTHWKDRVWGVDLNKDDDPLTSHGRNWLGTLLMARRAELVAEATWGHVGQQDVAATAFTL